MSNSLKSINIGLNLATAKLISYNYIFYENNDSWKDKILNQLIITIQVENEKKIEFIFYDPEGFMDRGGEFFHDFCLNTEMTCFFKKTIEEIYTKIPDNHPYKLYVFIDKNQQTCLEIISPYFEFKFLEDKKN
jgi:hypothetical protein